MGELGFRFSVLRIQCLKGRSFSLSELRSVISGPAGPPSPLRNVGNVWHTKLLFFLYTDVIEMNLPECSLGEVALRDQGVLMPLLWVYVCACVCKSHGFSHVLFV